MAMQKYISLAELPTWLAELSAAATVYVPKREGKAVVYRPFTAGDTLELAQRPTESAKHSIFPRAEELFRFSYQGDPQVVGGKNLALQEAEEPSPAVVFGLLSCDARGFFAFDPVYDGCGTQGRTKDTYYLKRRDHTTLIVRACRTALSTCFCHWVGGGPASKEGADILCTDVADGFLFEALTEKGEVLLTSSKLTPATEVQSEAALVSHAKVEVSMGAVPDITTVPASLAALFDNTAFWKKESASCISCGVCTYLCPTCYCFNITDESNGISGVRLRSWDTCMSSMFTLEASGHNPRANRAMRLRNRIGHKYAYYPQLHQGRFSCSGCGRCIKSCPSSIDIRRIVQNSMSACIEKEASRG